MIKTNGMRQFAGVAGVRKRDWHTYRTNAKVNPRSQASERFLDLNRSCEHHRFDSEHRMLSVVSKGEPEERCLAASTT